MKSIIVIASSPSHLFFLLPYIKTKFSEIKLLWLGKKNALDDLDNFIDLPRDIKFFNFKYINRWKPSIYESRKFKKFLLENFDINESSKSHLALSFNSGIQIEIIKSVLKIEHQNILIFDDGMSGFFEDINKLSFLKTLFCLFHGYPKVISKHRLFADKEYINGLSINPSMIFRGNNTSIKVKDISSYIKANFTNTYRNKFSDNFEDASALLLTHHSVETKRMSENDYFLKINKVINEIKRHDIHNIYFTMHHSENHDVKYKQYIDLGLLPIESQSLPAEVLCCSDNIKLIAQPFNSLVFMAGSLGILDNKSIVSYHLANQPFIQDRERGITTLVNSRNINHQIIS